MISYHNLCMRNTRNKGNKDASEYAKILAREGDYFRIEHRGVTKPVTLAIIIQMVACGYAFSNISFMKPYMRY